MNFGLWSFCLLLKFCWAFRPVFYGFLPRAHTLDTSHLFYVGLIWVLSNAASRNKSQVSLRKIVRNLSASSAKIVWSNEKLDITMSIEHFSFLYVSVSCFTCNCSKIQWCDFARAVDYISFNTLFTSDLNSFWFDSFWVFLNISTHGKYCYCYVHKFQLVQFLFNSCCAFFTKSYLLRVEEVHPYLMMILSKLFCTSRTLLYRRAVFLN